MNTPAIQLQGVTKSFPGFSLGPVNLTVPRGAIYGLIGPNGSGKSTTLDLLFGMGLPDGGSMSVAGYDALRQEREMKLRATYVSPDTQFTVWGTVGKAIAFVQGFYPHWDTGMCERLLDLFRLGRSEKIALLSFGARTKLSLLLALCPQPEVIVLDEPTTGLDPEARKFLFEELLRFVADENRTVLISSHQLSDLERFADHIGILSQGTLICEGQTAEFVQRYQLVEYSLEDHFAIPNMPGFMGRKSHSSLQQAVVDLAMHPVSTLQARGLTIHSQTELPLEDIFIALTSTRKETSSC